MIGRARRIAAAALTAAALAAPRIAAAAPPHKILVLPTDGTADAATRAKLTAQVARLARRLDGQVATGDATFADAALAVGCDPAAAGCSDEVMTTLGVDELVWSSATRGPGQTQLTVRRAARGAATREQAATLVAGGAARADTSLAPLFAPPADPTEPAPAPMVPPPVVAATVNEPATSTPSNRERGDHNVALVVGIGGALAMVAGIALWGTESSLQDQIDAHPTRTRGDLDDLISLEDRASTYAIAGDVLVVAGLAAGGVAAYYLFRDHRAHGVAIAPAPNAHGGGVTLTITGGFL